MRKMPSRQVHLDFHTSPLIPGVGSQFDKKQFQAALKEGNLNSITVFAKCHHGYCYYPTKVGSIHPTMDPSFDLTGAMVDAAHEIGVAAPIYITGGWCALDAEQHPEWRMLDKDGNPLDMHVDANAAPDDPRPDCSWWDLCLTGDYAQHIYDITQEVVDRYPVVDGLFYDIIFMGRACYCPNCIKGMKELGMNPDNEEEAQEYYRMKHLEFMKKCSDILHAKHPEATIFFNGGADIYRPEYHASHTHIEMEDLPTAWGGYNKMPPRASFMSRYDMEYLGMTGKFHTTWGEFGGYKNPDALKYEVLLMAMYGAKCSIGDQMPPHGAMDMETYKLIGHAYRALEKIEPWVYPASSTADLGVYLGGRKAADEGLHAMLLESHIDFEIAMPCDDLSRFSALVLPDCVELSDEEAARIQQFADKGGAVLMTGMSGIRNGRFQIDTGAKYIGEARYRQDYLCAGECIKLPFGNAPFLCYQGAQTIELTDGEAIAALYPPYFDRTYAHYCSHMNTPYQPDAAATPAAVRKGSVVYFAHPLCSMYKNDGAQLFREMLIRALKLIYTPRYSVTLPSAGRTRLTAQPDKNRYVFHAAYGSPIQRGRTSVIEDLPPIYQV
ncbi:MAG: beta-galactosidase trimerization domain-containing protein, partial [Clostridia bacterium]|nr:beta-galactosidase trimerization domain-containing protein [Clostridia bacterium]